jgi:hypothetical protein
MEIKLKAPDLHSYNSGDHIEFHKTSYTICDKYGAVINAPELISAYKSKVTQEEGSFKWIRRSEYTEKKAEVDNNRDSTYTGMAEIVRASMRHFDPSIRDSALHIDNLLANYGDLTHAGYDAETAGIDSIIARLNSPAYSPAVQALGLASWVTELANQNALFKNYVDDAAQEQIDKPDITPQAARRETDKALRKIVKHVTALVTINGGDSFAAFAGEFNVLVKHYNTLVREHYGRLHAKTDIAVANIMSIPVQQYTGRPVHVIPIVSINKADKTVELVFSEDFSVAYKNNVEPGSATLIIKGIGKYTGELVTTFNIEKKN